MDRCNYNCLYNKYVIECGNRKHCIHEAVQCLATRLKGGSTYCGWWSMPVYLEKLQQQVYQYLEDHPEEGLEL